MLYVLWIALSAGTGMFAYTRRNRNGLVWLLLALIISPPVAFVLCAIMDPKPSRFHAVEAAE